MASYDDMWLNMNRARESGYDPTASNPRSSAYGVDQFIAPTWLTLARRYRPDWKGLSDNQVLSYRSDPKTSEEFVGYNNKENSNYLTSKGADVNNVNLGLAHRFGPATTMSLLSADPSTPMSSLVNAKVLAANPDLRGKTVNDVITGYQDTFQKSAGNKEPILKTAMGPQPTTQDAKSALGISGAPMLLGSQDASGIQAPTNEATTGPVQADSGGYDWGKALLGVGAGLSSIDNPQGAAIALGMMRDRTKANEWDLVKAGNKLFRVNKTTGDIQPYGPDTGVDNEAFDKADAKEAAKELTASQAAVQDGANRLAKLSQLKSYAENPNVYQGFAGGAVAVLKNAAKTFGFDEQALGNDETQAFRALANQFSLSIRNPKAGEGLPGNLSDKDLVFLKQSAPSLDNAPEGNKKIIDYMTKIEQHNLEYNQEKAKYIASNKGRTGLAEHMESWRNSHDVFKDEPNYGSSNADGFKILDVK